MQLSKEELGRFNALICMIFKTYSKVGKIEKQLPESMFILI